MIKVKMRDILELGRKREEAKKLMLKGSTAFHLARLMKQIVQECQGYDEGMRNFIELYGKRNKDDSLMTTPEGHTYIKDDMKEEFQEQVLALLEAEVEILVEPLGKSFDMVDMDMELAEVFLPFM